MFWRILGLSLVISTHSLANEVTFIGRATDLVSGELLYEERHSLTFNEQGDPEFERVEYFNANQQKLGEKVMRYRHPTRPEYDLQFNHVDRSESVRIDQSRVVIEGDKPQEATLPETRVAIDGGFHYVIVENFDALVQGNDIDFDFLSAARGTFIAMTAIPVAQSNGELTLELRLQNFILSRLVKPIELTYDIQNRQLLKYKGLTNVPDANEKLFQASIEYIYPQQVTFITGNP